MSDKKIECPDCHEQVLKSALKDHVLNCKVYKKTYYKNVERSLGFLNQSSIRLKFLMAELGLIQDRLKAELCDSQSEQQQLKESRSKQSRNTEELKNHNKARNQFKGQSVRQTSQDKFSASKKQQQQNSSQFDRFLRRKQQSEQKVEERVNSAVIQNPEKREVKETVKHGPSQEEAQDYLEQLLSSKNKPTSVKKTESTSDMIACSKCHSHFLLTDAEKFYFADICLHPICRICLQEYLTHEYVKTKSSVKYPCPYKGCNEEVPYYQLVEIFGKQRMEKLEDEMMGGLMTNLVTCQKCNAKYEFIKGKAADAPKIDSKGKKLEEKYKEDFAQFRFSCPNCRTQQCKMCHTIPYHIGMTCAEFKDLENRKKCRYCKNPLPPGYTSANGMRAFDDVCEENQCYQKSKLACSKIHKDCGHSCSGYIQEKNCLPCLKEKCALKKSKELNGQNEDSFCSICYIEGLGSSPCIQIQCGHIFHYECLQKRLQTKWLGPRILFNFCHCPLCNVWINVPKGCKLNKLIEDSKRLSDQVKQKALQRLKYEEQDKNEKLEDKSSPYYNQPQKYALAIYAYFECFKCKKPYFGGRKSCAEAMNDQREGDFKPEQLICPTCCPIKVTKNCKKHGKQFVSFKCKFCCSVAQFFCWGSTHFCNKCHDKQIKGEQVNKIPKDKLPKCEGKGKCPVGGNHPPNGQTYSLGCGICLNDKNSIQDF